MKMFIRFGGLALLALLASAPSRAQLTVQPSVSFLSGTFTYSYNVSNQTQTDFSIITLSGLFPAPGSIFNLAAPSGFLASYDSGVNLLSFFEGSQAFAAGTVSAAFTFDSPYAPTLGAFEAIDITGGITLGDTQVPGLATSAVPEPATTAAFGALALIGLVFHRKIFAKKTAQS